MIGLVVSGLSSLYEVLGSNFIATNVSKKNEIKYIFNMF